MPRKPKSKAGTIPTANPDDLPATRGMMNLLKNELLAAMRAMSADICAQMKAQFAEMRAETNERFAKVDTRFLEMDTKILSIDGRLDRMDARFDRMDARFDRMDAKLERVEVQVHRTGVLVEEQRADNRLVLEGHQGLWQQLSRIESRLPQPS